MSSNIRKTPFWSKKPFSFSFFPISKVSLNLLKIIENFSAQHVLFPHDIHLVDTRNNCSQGRRKKETVALFLLTNTASISQNKNCFGIASVPTSVTNVKTIYLLWVICIATI